MIISHQAHGCQGCRSSPGRAALGPRNSPRPCRCGWWRGTAATRTPGLSASPHIGGTQTRYLHPPQHPRPRPGPAWAEPRKTPPPSSLPKHSTLLSLSSRISILSLLALLSVLIFYPVFFVWCVVPRTEPQNWCVGASPDYLFSRGDALEITNVQREAAESSRLPTRNGWTRTVLPLQGRGLCMTKGPTVFPIAIFK